MTDEPARNRVHVLVVNFRHEEIELPKATVLGVAEETSAGLVAEIIDTEYPNVGSSREPSNKADGIESDTSFKQYLKE